jgi:hypothetical protein
MNSNLAKIHPRAAVVGDISTPRQTTTPLRRTLGKLWKYGSLYRRESAIKMAMNVLV